MIYKNGAGEIKLDCIPFLSERALDTYKYYNQEKFEGICDTFDIFENTCKQIDLKHCQKLYRRLHPFICNLTVKENNKVLLAFSGGLDSVYQSFVLREKGYDVTLFHVKNMNYYTNGKEFQVVSEFAEYFKFPLVVAEFKQNTKNNLFKKYWKENSFKNTLLYSMMFDYCLCYKISNISSGDDLRLDLKDTVIGTNVADAKEITLSFFNEIKKYRINFIPIEQKVHKGIRMRKLTEHNAINLFYSCINPGRFNQSNHNRIENKFNVKLEKWNCGVCRKCAFHSLLRYYYLEETFPDEFIDFCWNKVANGADYAFFKPSLPLEVRIKNLFEY